MKIKIVKSLKEGVEVLKKNPIIFAPFIFIALISYLLNFYLNREFAQSLMMILEKEMDVTSILSALPIGKIISISLVSSIISFYLFLVAIKLVYDSFKIRPALVSALSVGLKKFIPIFLAGFLVFLLVLTIIGVAFVISALIAALVIAAGGPEALMATLISFIIAAAFIALIFFQIKFLFYPYAGIIDDQKTIGSLKMSWQITTGNWWPLLVLLLLTLLITFILSLVAIPFPQTIEIPLGMLIQTLTTAWVVSVFASTYLQIRS